MHWWVTHYRAGRCPVARGTPCERPSLDAAKRKLAAALDVPVWTLR